MKIKDYKYTRVDEEKELSVDEYVDELINDMDSEFLRNYNEEDIGEYIDECLQDDTIELTDEEYIELEEKLTPRVKAKYKELYESALQEEKDILKDRQHILSFFEEYFNMIDYPYPGELGFALSNEEILDLIIQNGNKNRS